MVGPTSDNSGFSQAEPWAVSEADPWDLSEDVPPWDPEPEVELQAPAPLDPAPELDPMSAAPSPVGSWFGSARRLLAASSVARYAPVAVGATAVIAFADGWRTSLLAVLAAGAIFATRIRFGVRAATAVLAATALLALIGWGPASEARPMVERVHRSHRLRRAHRRHDHHRPAGADRHHPHSAEG
jgi:hypothetical protein